MNKTFDRRVIEKKREEFWSQNPAYRVVYDKMRKQGYHFVGTTGVVKRCYWTKEAILHDRFCYKCLWYGIESHRCIQFSPAAAWCWNRCLHCWRVQPDDTGLHWDEAKLPVIDDPSILVEESIWVFKHIVSGFRANPYANDKRIKEALEPKHVAISLVGEPLLYSKLSELIKAYHERGLTTFLVTRGVRPDVLASLDEEPTQLYVSVEAWCREKYNEFNRPVVPKAWDLFMETLELMPSMSNPSVLRITLIKGFNDNDEALTGFKRIIEKAQPWYVEVKAYMFMGYSKNRLKPVNMPSHEQVKSFASKLSVETSYEYIGESVPSRVVLLSRVGKPKRHGNGCPDGVEHPERYAPVVTGEYEEARED